MLEKFKFWQSLRMKLIAATLLVEVIMLSILVWNNLRLSESALIEQNIVKVNSVLPLLDASLSGPIIQEDLATLNEVVSQIVNKNSLRYVRITNVVDEVFVQYGKLSQSEYQHGDHKGFDSEEFKQHLLDSRRSYRFSIPVKLDKSVVGYITLEFDTSSVVNALTKAKQEGLFIATIEIFLSTLILLLIGVTLTRRLGALSQAASQMAEGNLGVRIETSGHDEVSQTSQAFNLMAEKVQREQAQLIKSENDLSLTLQSIGDAVIVTDTTGNITRLNGVAETLTGWTLEQASGMPLEKVFDTVDAVTRVVLENPVKKALRGEYHQSLNTHTLLIAKNGNEYHIADSAAPIVNESGETLGVILVFRDVTNEYILREERDRNQQRLQAVLDNAPAVIYLKDIDGRFLLINKRFETLFNISNDAIKGKTLHDVFPKDIADEMQANDLDVLHARVPLQSEEQAPLGDGIHTYISTKFCLFNDSGEPYAICGISTDITEKRTQEDLLKRTQKMDALGKLTGGIAHDYNNMLNVILGYAELLSNELPADSSLSRYAKEISHAGDRGAALTRKLLAFSAQQPSKAGVTDINAILREDETMLAKTLTSGIRLNLQLANGIWPVWLDQSDLEDAVLNISLNAMQAMPNGGRLDIVTSNEVLSTVEANALGLGSKGDYVRITITDTGVGMDSIVQSRIFDSFFSTKGEFGTGLGLSQVYGFTQRSRGTVRVHSEPNQGTRILMYFPRYHDTVRKIREPLVSPRIENLNGSETILVVDDEPALRNLARDILEGHGYQVLVAANAKIALMILSKQPVDMLLSDINMPGMDGYELAAIVAKQYPGIVMQLASGFGINRDIAPADETLHKDMLRKPFSSLSLLRRVRELFDGKTSVSS